MSQPSKHRGILRTEKVRESQRLVKQRDEMLFIHVNLVMTMLREKLFEDGKLKNQAELDDDIFLNIIHQLPEYYSNMINVIRWFVIVLQDRVVLMPRCVVAISREWRAMFDFSTNHYYLKKIYWSRGEEVLSAMCINSGPKVVFC